ncbi:protein CrcB [Arthrobacter crystallopoietes BAB-32]|uniref:Fluoride-specific ion channel FluC n=1 Tax=Arthrobacter crystallopoietes BAB-32 TaxID=1246476 RepID=N1V7T5_9MICC|nr:CrcB family protein [Arthrobacter crystallopoietes]EMY34283.1 protein CrcB [Arthrobacter crystallopoietes BAB-32]
MDTNTDGATQRPQHLQPGAVLLVMAGGALGALARHSIGLLLPPAAGWPLATLAANLSGAFVLGLLLEFLALGARNDAGTRAVRLAAGTGFLGAFTTYSALALEANLLLAEGQTGTAIAYLLATLAGGFLASLAGVGVASRWLRREP